MHQLHNYYQTFPFYDKALTHSHPNYVQRTSGTGSMVIFRILEMDVIQTEAIRHELRDNAQPRIKFFFPVLI